MAQRSKTQADRFDAWSIGEVKVLDKENGLVSAVVSTELPDRDSDIIRARGWDLENFKKHPILLADHNYRDVRAQIGEWTEMEVKGKKLVGVAEYYIGKGNEKADWAFELAKRGKGAYSVGFIPDMSKAKEIEGTDPFFPSFEFNGQELLEVSHVTVPANPQALQSRSLHPIVREILESEIADTQALDMLEPVIRNIVEEVMAPFMARLCAAIAPHGTATSEGSWDGPANEARLRVGESASYYRRAYAWVDADGDPKTKSAYRFIHHEVSADGSIGAANLTAASAGIAVLNGARGGTTIPDSDKQGVWNHLARHLRDADREPPELRGAWDIPDLRTIIDHRIAEAFR